MSGILHFAGCKLGLKTFMIYLVGYVQQLFGRRDTCSSFGNHRSIHSVLPRCVFAFSECGRRRSRR